jgi:hypothetical protein
MEHAIQKNTNTATNGTMATCIIHKASPDYDDERHFLLDDGPPTPAIGSPILAARYHAGGAQARRTERWREEACRDPDAARSLEAPTDARAEPGHLAPTAEVTVARKDRRS